MERKRYKYESLIGQRFGRLVVIDKVDTPPQKPFQWVCQCDCGNISTPQGASLKNGSATSCGCYGAEKRGASRFIDLTGQRFGRLVVIDRGENKGGKPAWNCICDCGAKKLISAKSLRSERTTSCGCYNRSLTKIPRKKIEGLNINEWTLIKYEDDSDSGDIRVSAVCSCGTKKTVNLNSLLRKDGNSKSCGCKRGKFVSENRWPNQAEKWIESILKRHKSISATTEFS